MLGWIILISFLVLAIIVLCFLLVRAVRKMMEFDDLWQMITDELISYDNDLREMASGDLLVDHPEVQAFHKRNLRALATVSVAAKQLQMIGRKVDKNHLPPLVE